MYLGIDHVQVAAPKNSEEACRKFYGQVLQMEEIVKPENLRKRGGVWFKCGAQQLHIGIQETFIPAKKAHPAFLVEDLDHFVNLLKENHIEIIEDEPLLGYIRIYVHDPFGNRLEFLQKI